MEYQTPKSQHKFPYFRDTTLEVSSAIATVTAVSEVDDEEAIERVITAFEDVGRHAEQGLAPQSSPRVVNAVNSLCGLINGHISSILFQTQDFDAEAVAPLGIHQGVEHGRVAFESIGATYGRVQSMSSRGGLRFTLYDANDDHAVSCYLQPGMEKKMRDAWGRLCSVSGVIRRSASGKLTTVRDVSDVILLKETPSNAWRSAIGCSPAIPGSIGIEEAIRKGRDG